ncbi:MAG: hypothetical protein H7222_07070 [Methylotenera sp.]|nr:hypothetical protein [Oligoflexia bacterium]
MIFSKYVRPAVAASFTLMAVLPSSAFAVAAPVVTPRSVSGCLLTSASSEWGGITLIRVTSVNVNPGGNTVVVEGSDGVFGASDGWGNYRSGKTVTVQFQLNPVAPQGKSLSPNAKIGAIECLNNARIAMANGMNISFTGNMKFGIANVQDPASACTLKAVQNDKWGAGYTNDIGDCPLAIANPQLKSKPVQP